MPKMMMPNDIRMARARATTSTTFSLRSGSVVVAIEQPERYRRQHEEVDCRDTIDMIGQKGPPALRRRPTPVHIACDRRLRDCEPELEQFTMNVWCTPEVICITESLPRV